VANTTPEARELKKTRTQTPGARHRAERERPAQRISTSYHVAGREILIPASVRAKIKAAREEREIARAAMRIAKALDRKAAKMEREAAKLDRKAQRLAFQLARRDRLEEQRLMQRARKRLRKQATARSR
jgi:hypothetical protein